MIAYLAGFGAEAEAAGDAEAPESRHALEGCSRLVPAGQAEDMIRYVDVGRCFWSSNS